MFFVTCVGLMLSTLSMAEMASMAPTSGGQYHWVSEFAPQRHQKFLSYMVGWVSALGWQTALVVTAYTASQQFEALIALNVPSSYRIQGWHGTLLSIAVTIFAIIFNTAMARKLPLFEVLVGVLNVLGFAAFLTVLWSMAPPQDAANDNDNNTRRKNEAWTEFQDNAGWGNVGLATLVGILGPSVTLIGADSACHLSEEVRDASWVLPRSMVVTAAINYTVGFVMTVTVMMTVGDHASELLDSRMGQVYVQVLLNVTQSRLGTSVLTALMAVLLLFCAVNGVTTSSRQLFAFARDNGLPCSRWLATVPADRDIPLNAVMTTLAITALLSLIIIGSSIAFNVIAAIGQVGLYTSYIITLGAIIARRFSRRRGPLPRSRFDLGRAGLPINLGALAFLMVMFPFLFFPSAPNPSPAEMNWSCLVYSVVVVFTMMYYFFKGRHVYQGPVEYVRKDI
ncbi:amino acid transporter [Apiospora marii]|uniref:Amino acid transporter n=2 Tax=Apiospora marii TaxID=335849 RepID=A0ABR1RBI5_9PEZI